MFRKGVRFLIKVETNFCHKVGTTVPSKLEQSWTKLVQHCLLGRYLICCTFYVNYRTQWNWYRSSYMYTSTSASASASPSVYHYYRIPTLPCSLSLTLIWTDSSTSRSPPVTSPAARRRLAGNQLFCTVKLLRVFRQTTSVTCTGVKCH